jgi:hypothetical protein
MDTALKDELAGRGPFVAAWDLDGRTDATWTLALFTLESGGPKKVVAHEVPHAERQALQDELRSLGVQVGFFDAGCDHVWVKDGGRFLVFGPDGVSFEVGEKTASVATGETVEREHIRSVVAFAGGPEHGVALELDTGQRIPVAVEGAVTAMGDPSVTRSEVVHEAMWASLLSRQLGQWLGVPSDLEVDGSDEGDEGDEGDEETETSP